MALFTRHKGRPRGSNVYSTRGSRGAKLSRGGRGRGRSRGSFGTKPGERSTFYSTRVENQTQDASEDGSLKSQSRLEDELEASGGSSDSEEEDLPIDVVKPYNALLHSLSANVPAEPERKKRKIEQTKFRPGPDIQEQETGAIAELEETLHENDEDDEDVVNDDIDDGDKVDAGNDPFIEHFNSLDEDQLLQEIRDLKERRLRIEKPPNGRLRWSCSFNAPHSSSTWSKQTSKPYESTDRLSLKERLKDSGKKLMPSFDSLAGNLAFLMFNYRDILFPYRNLENAGILRKLACLHTLNHVFKTRDKVIKNNARLAKEGQNMDTELRDQGFTRPKVLFLLPTRHACFRYIETLICLCEPEQQENKKRFQDSFVSGNDHFSEDKPEDFRELFAGNDDDLFRLGIKFARKSIKFFSQFSNSDMIFASPLGLRMALGADDPKKQDYDFLSSIEVVVVDQVDALLMQNWEHMENIFDHLNLQPQEAHGCDWSRVRNWYMDGNARYLRQTILFSAFNFPSLNKLYIHHMLNVAGKAKYSQDQEGAMVDLRISPKQTFSRFEFTNSISEPDDRFKYFSTAVVPSLTNQNVKGSQGVLIYIPSYADFVRIRNYMANSSGTQGISFGSISEYTSVRDIARARSHFHSGRHSVLLYTERAHHFRRYHLEGVKKVVMYGLPDNSVFYKEIVEGYLGSSTAAAKLDARDASVRALFSRLDLLKLERVVGTSRYISMLEEKGGDTFDFV